LLVGSVCWSAATLRVSLIVNSGTSIATQVNFILIGRNSIRIAIPKHIFPGISRQHWDAKAFCAPANKRAIVKSVV